MTELNNQLIIGKTFKHFTVLKKLARVGGNGYFYYLCECECGTQKEVRQDNLGRVKSCGCVRSEYRQRVSKQTFNLSSAAKKAKATKPKKSPKYKPSITLDIETKLEMKRIEKEYQL